MSAPKRFPAGRRRDSDKRPQNVVINFKADPKTIEALEGLEAELGAGIINGRRSAVIRQALQQAWNQLRAGNSK